MLTVVDDVDDVLAAIDDWRAPALLSPSWMLGPPPDLVALLKCASETLVE